MSTLRPPRVIEDRSLPTCDDDDDPTCANVLIPAHVADALWAEREGYRNDPAKLAAWRVKLDAARRAARTEALRIRAAKANRENTTKGDAMGCQCNERRDAAERERLARQKMIEDSANAHRAPGADDHVDSEPAPTGSREQIARETARRASRDAYKTGGR